MAILTREQILDAKDEQKELVAVPEWGGEVWVYGLSASERDRFEQSLVALKGKHRRVDLTNVRAKLVSQCVRDEAGAALFTPGDVDALSRKSGKAMDRVFDVAQRLSGLRDEDIEDLVGN